MPVKPWAGSVYWMFAVELDPDLHTTALEMIVRLHHQGIGARPFFLGLHALPALHELGLCKNRACPKTDFANQFGFYLPSGPALDEATIIRIAEPIAVELHR